MLCAESVRVQAHFDGELDAISSLNLEHHTKHCGECGELLESLERTKAMLRRDLPEFRAPPELSARIQRALDIEDASGGVQPTAHVSSLMSAHLIDVVSTDKHTVKPWFAGRAAVSPAVADFASHGYRLTGGRVDYLEHQRAAVTVYQHGPHVMNVFCWSATLGPLPGNATRQGYHLVFWRSGDLAYAAVSDTGWSELLGLERLLRDLGASDSPPDDSSPN